MPNSTVAAGDPIEARCTKCRKNTAHLVITLSDRGPEKVQCQSCSREHKYRPPTAARKPAARRTVDPRKVERQEWETLRPGMDRAAAAKYSMTGAYKIKSLIDHPLFGLGLVQRVVGPQKIEVLFEDGRKTMRCK